MRSLRGVFLVVAVALLAGPMLQGQDKKDDTPAKVKGVLPANWGKLGLTDEQKQKVYKVQADYNDKIGVLEKQLKDLKATEKSEMEKVLTDAQKARLAELLKSKLPATDDKKPTDKKTDDKKPDEKK
jgi:Spy/CpxP family protein refolding chaperone